jgi:hypothetical protein
LAPDRFWEFPARAPWALRLIQIQLSLGYLSAVWHKAGNDLWRDGSAVSYALRMQDIHRAPTPGFITHSGAITELLTFGTLALELGLAILVWNRAARPWVLALGMSLHMMIDLNILVGFFSYAMLVAYLSFVPPDTAAARLLATRDLLGRAAGRLGRPKPEQATALGLAAHPNASVDPLALAAQSCNVQRDRGHDRTAGMVMGSWSAGDSSAAESARR